MRSKWPTIITILIVVLLIGGGVWAYFRFFSSGGTDSFINIGKKSDSKLLSGNNYVSFIGDYAFKIPEDYVVDDSTVVNAQLIVKKDAQIEVEEINEIYEQGVIAVQPFNPILNDDDAFKKYIKESYAQDTSNALKGETEVEFTQKDKITVAILTTTQKGEIIRTQYVYNSLRPVLVVGKEKNQAFEAITSSVVVASEKIKDYSQMQSTISTFATLLKGEMFSDAYRLCSSEFKKENSQEDLEDKVKETKIAVDANISVSGAILNDDGNEFTSVLIFTKLSQKEGQAPENAIGNMTFVKEGKDWKLSGMSIPSDDAFEKAQVQ